MPQITVSAPNSKATHTIPHERRLRASRASDRLGDKRQDSIKGRWVLDEHTIATRPQNCFGRITSKQESTLGSRVSGEAWGATNSELT